MLRRGFSVIVLCVLVTAVVVAPALAGKRRAARRDEIPYRAPTAGAGGVISQCDEHDQVGCADFVPRLAEKFILVTVEDDSGSAVYANLAQDIDDDGVQEFIHRFCGEMDEPIEIDPTKKVTVHVFAGPGYGDPTCVGPATSGLITVRHSTRR